MNVIKGIIGAVLILGGIILGIYVGVILLFIGGIVQLIQGAQASPIEVGDVVWGAVKAFILAEGCGGLAFFVLAAPGVGFIGSAINSDKHQTLRGKSNPFNSTFGRR